MPITLLDGKSVMQNSQEVEWFWKNRIPKKAISMLAALGGQGKSGFALWLCLEYGCKLGKRCMYVDTEQTFVHISSRLKEWAPASVENLIVPVEKDESNLIESACPTIEQIAKWATEYKCEFVVIDSLTTLGARYDLNKRNEAADVFKQLRTIAVRANAALMVIAHLNKPFDRQKEGLSIANVSGSQALIDLSRSVLLMEDAASDGCSKRLIHGKSNFCARQPDIEFTMDDTGVNDFYEIPDPSTCKLKTGSTQATFNELALQAAQDNKNKRVIRKEVKDAGGSEMNATRAVQFLVDMGYKFK